MDKEEDYRMHFTEQKLVRDTGQKFPKFMPDGKSLTLCMFGLTDEGDMMATLRPDVERVKAIRKALGNVLIDCGQRLVDDDWTPDNGVRH